MHWSVRRTAAILLTVSAFAGGGAAAGRAGPLAHQRPAWQRERAALDQRHLAEEFRIHYTLAGKDALPAGSQRDADGDGVPDRIRNLALQLLAARRCYVEVLGLRHPFASPRYRDRVKCIDVNVWALPGSNGLAGDAVVNYHRDNDPPEGVDVLTIDVSTKLTDRNLTPAHELFHLFQNGYSLFKTAWYYEGIARWSEDLLRAGTSEAGALPGSAADLKTLFSLKYEASRFWLALARATGSQGEVRIPEDLTAIRYSGSDRLVVEDGAFLGAELLKALLEELDRQDDATSRERGLDPLDWPEAQQRDSANSPAIWQAVIAACQRFPARSQEIRQMPEL